MPVLPIEVLSTSTIKYDGTNHNIDSASWQWFADRYYGGFRCRVAEADLPADPTDIDSVVLTVMAGTSNPGGTTGLLTAITDGGAWGGSYTPLSEWSAAASANGTTSASWGDWTINTTQDSTDCATPVAAAIDASVNDGGYRYFSILWKPDSTVGFEYVQIYTTGNTTPGNRPYVTASYLAPANFTASLPAIAPTVTVDALGVDVDVDATGVSALGTGAGTARLIDVYLPRTGTKPASGWPVVVFVHGGRWVAGSKNLGPSENSTSRPLVEKFTDEGYAVASVRYRLCEESLITSTITHSFPRNVHDILAAMEYLHTNAADYRIDSSKMILGGHSAGGHLAGFAAIAAATSDSTTYNGSQNSTSDRPAGYGYSDTASPWQFDFDESGQLSAPAPIGIMLWDTPVDVYLATTIGGMAGTANTNARKALMGEALGSAVYDTEDEADLNHYIAGDGTVYTTAKSAGDIPPIFFLYGTNEDVVLNSASITAMESALDAIGYDTSTGVGVLNTSGGLTKHSVARDHADVLRGQAPDFAEGIAWLAEVTAGAPSLPIYVGADRADVMKAGTADVDAVYVGSTKAWP